MADTVRVQVGDKQFVTMYTKSYFDLTIGSGDALPTASKTYRGKLFTLHGASGAIDQVYICLKQADDSYAWKDLLTFRFGP